MRYVYGILVGLTEVLLFIAAALGIILVACSALR